MKSDIMTVKEFLENTDAGKVKFLTIDGEPVEKPFEEETVLGVMLRKEEDVVEVILDRE